MNVVFCRTCGEPIGFCRLTDGRWRPVEPVKKYIMPDESGPDSGISEMTGALVRGSWTWPKTGAAVVYPVHLCAAIPAAEKGISTE